MSIKQPFEKVVEEHGRTVLRVCRALLASHDADDAWSETFLSACAATRKCRRRPTWKRGW